MFSACNIWREHSKAWARRLFRIEQLESNSVLRGLPASRRHKVIQRLYKNLSKEDMASLTIRATLYEQRVRAGHPHPLDHDAVRVTRQQAHGRDATSLITPSPPSQKSPAEVGISSFEFFIKEQGSNPALKGLDAKERQAQLKTIYDTLPDNAREALQQRARVYAAAMAAKAIVKGNSQSASTGSKVTTRRKSKKRNTRATRRRPPKKPTTKRKPKSKPHAARAKSKTRQSGRTPSAYAVFVKEQMPSVMDRPPKDRLKEISRRWKAREVVHHDVQTSAKVLPTTLSPQKATAPATAIHNVSTVPPTPLSSSSVVPSS